MNMEPSAAMKLRCIVTASVFFLVRNRQQRTIWKTEIKVRSRVLT